jgi:hypothetical protein
VRSFLADNRRAGLAAIEARLGRGVAEGDVPAGADAAAIAAFVTTVLQGLSIQARDGADAATLGRVIDGAMAAFDAMAGA